jgi:hypothetical protein
MPIYYDNCRERYTLGAHILFLVCLLREGHDGNHWDAALEVAWSTGQPSAELAQPFNGEEEQ